MKKFEKSIHLNLEYNMDIDGLFEGKNKVSIYVEEIS